MSRQRAWYRLWQFLIALWALIRPPRDDRARRLLTPTEYALFRQQAPYDQSHALRVLRHLRQRGVENRSLLKAALLHDVGKSAGEEGIPLLYRGPIVLARGRPRLWAWLSQERPRGDLRRPFYLYTTHAARSVELARSADAAQEVLALIARHDDPQAEGLAATLQAADQQS